MPKQIAQRLSVKGTMSAKELQEEFATQFSASTTQRKLDSMELEGSVFKEQESQRPFRNFYSITEAGYKKYIDEVAQPESEQEPINELEAANNEFMKKLQLIILNSKKEIKDRDLKINALKSLAPIVNDEIGGLLLEICEDLA